MGACIRWEGMRGNELDSFSTTDFFPIWEEFLIKLKHRASVSPGYMLLVCVCVLILLASCCLNVINVNNLIAFDQ